MSRRRLTIFASPEAESALAVLMHESGHNQSIVICDALRFAYHYRMYPPMDERVDIAPLVGRGSGPGQGVGGGRPPREDTIKKIIESFGGLVDSDGMVTFMKYEETPTGLTARNERVVPIGQLGKSVAEIKKNMLGPYKDLKEAERVFRKQNK